MRKLQQPEITHEFLRRAVLNSHEFTRSMQNVSAILAGFSLGAVVALLFVNDSALSRTLFVLSLCASWLFLISTTLHFLYGYSYGKLLLYIDRFERVDELYRIVRRHKSIDLLSGAFWVAGMMCFVCVLSCAGFFHSDTLGYASCSAAIVLLLIVLYVDRKTVGESAFFDWN